MLDNLKGKRIILASKSPRRQNLLKGLDIDFEIITREIEEVWPEELPAKEVAEYLAKLKNSAFEDLIDEDTIVITSDTTVYLNDRIVNKPIDREDAMHMLREISGSRHTVFTGVCIATGGQMETFTSSTDVYFKDVEEEELAYYLDKYEPYDKAGAYGIQEWIGYIGIEKIEGDFFNVMGFPLNKVYDILKAM